MNKEQFFKDLQDWEREYAAMDVERTKREEEILKGDPIKSHEGMMYGRMYADWKKRKGYELDV
tara:strand:- start:1363 stop:1551 length:189 start_codon:yes stop_codon:yes gene_type:complete